MSKLHSIFWSAAFVMLAIAAQAQSSSGPSADLPDSRTLSVQRKVDELFESGEFERAYIIYRDELAPVGDKYAQYMVGYMHLMGMGVDEDEVQASAWYRLAAERGYPEFVAVRNQLLESLDDEDLLRSDLAFIDIRKKYSDLVLMMSMLRTDLDNMGNRITGSRLSGRSGTVTIVDPDTGLGMSGDSYHRKLRSRMRVRLDFVTERLELDRMSADVDSADLVALQAEVDKHVGTVNDR